MTIVTYRLILLVTDGASTKWGFGFWRLTFCRDGVD